MQNHFTSVFQSLTYIVLAITQAQFIERNAGNFLLVLGGYGLFFLLLGANFCSLALFNFLSRSFDFTERPQR